MNLFAAVFRGLKYKETEHNYFSLNLISTDQLTFTLCITNSLTLSYRYKMKVKITSKNNFWYPEFLGKFSIVLKLQNCLCYRPFFITSRRFAAHMGMNTQALK